MIIYKKLKPFISLVCTLLIIVSVVNISVYAADTKTVTASTDASVKQGNSAYCYIYIDSSEGLAALDIAVHFDPAKVKILNVYNSINCTIYDSVTNTDNIQFSYILDGKGTTSKTRLFYFRYQVLSNADVGSSYFDITIGEAYDNALNDVAVSGSRCNFKITETVTNKTCSIYSSSSITTAIENEFTLNYQFSTYQIASGTAVITYDPELFEVVSVTNGEFLNGKIADVNTELLGEIYISFVSTEYNTTKRDFLSVTFRTIKNVTQTSEIIFKAAELIDKELNSISCNPYKTSVNLTFDKTYTGDAPAMKLDGTFSYDDMKITLVVSLEKDSRLGAGDFVVKFDPELVSYNSCTKGFSPTFFNINDKNVENGELKFHIISLTDIVTEEMVLTVEFDVKSPYFCETVDFTIEGTGITDSLTETVPLNFVDGSVWLEYQIKFLDYDGTLLQTGFYHYGDTVTEPVAPTRERDEYGIYTFSGWDKEVVPCTAETVYTATYDIEYTEYTVIFKNWDGTEISRTTYYYGEVVTVPETPVKEKDSYYIYNFDGWDKEVVNCSGNAEYMAVFSAEHYHTYKIVVTPPTCSAYGYTTYTCECGDIYKEEVPPTGEHTYGKWTVITRPTLNECGSKAHSCTQCCTVENESIPVIRYKTVDSLTINFSTKIISGINVGATNLDGFIMFIDEGYTWSYETLDSRLGTGSKAILKSGNTVIDEYTILIYGDLNGDGWYDAEDAFLTNIIVAGMLTQENLPDYIWTAADCNHDGVIDEIDVDLLMGAGLRKNDIDQNVAQTELVTQAAYIEYASIIDQSADMHTGIIPESDTNDAEQGTTTSDTNEDVGSDEPVTENDIDIEVIFANIFEFFKKIFVLVFSFIIK